MNDSNGQSPSEINPVFGFFTEISIIEHLTRIQMEKVLPNDMKSSHFSVLNHLVRTGKRSSPADLASAFQVARASMTNTIQKLEKVNYIEIKSDPLDGRGKLVLITKKGHKAHTQAVLALASGFAPLEKDLSQDLFIKILPSLNIIRQYMDTNR